jgi:hypothetical protein
VIISLALKDLVNVKPADESASVATPVPKFIWDSTSLDPLMNMAKAQVAAGVLTPIVAAQLIE